MYQRLEELGRISDVSVRVRDISEPGVEERRKLRMTTETSGLEAVCRQPRADIEMDRIVREWNEERLRQQRRQQQQQQQQRQQTANIE